MTADQLLRIRDKLSSLRSSVWSTWDRAYRYCIPYRYPQSTDGTSRTANPRTPINGKGVIASQDMAAGLYSNTVRVGEPWFTLTHVDEQAMQDEEVQRAYTSATIASTTELFTSNLAEQMLPLLLEYVVVGTGCMYMYWDSRKSAMKFRNYSVKDMLISEDADGTVDTACRSLKMDARQAMKFFSGENDTVSPAVSAKLGTDSAYDPEDYIHIVVPNADHIEGSRMDAAQPYTGYWLHVESRHVCREEHYPYMPYATPRSNKDSDCAYGTGQGMLALPDLDLLDRTTRDFYDAVELTNQPPVFLPTGISKRDVDLRPGAVNTILGTGDQIPIFMPSPANPASLQAMVGIQEANVEEYFFSGLFRMLQSAPPGMTATEVIERTNEKIQMLLPVVGGLMSELYRPIVLNTVTSMIMAGKIGDDQGLMKRDIVNVEYSSRLASKLKDVEVVRMMELAQAIAQISTLAQYPMAMSVIDIVQWIKRIAADKQIDPKLIRSDREIARLMAAENEEKARQQAGQNVASLIKPLDLNIAPQPGSPAAQMML